MASSLIVNLSQLTPREQVADAVYRAIDAIDMGDMSLLDDAATDDMSFKIGDHEVKGRAAAHQYLTPVSKLDTLHTLSNVRVEIAAEGRTAKMTCRAVARHMATGTGNTPGSLHYTTGGFYFIDLTRGGDEEPWRIRQWELKIVYREGDRGVMQG